MSIIVTLLTPEVISATFRTMVSLLLVAQGGLLTKQAGIENIGLEGLMLIGCFSGFVMNYYTSSWIVGVLSGVFFTLLVSIIFGVFVISLKAHEIVAGVAINLLGLGLTTYLLRALFGVKGAFTSPQVQGIPVLRLSVLGKIPFIGRVLNNQSIMVWFSIVVVLLLQYLLFHTRFGYYVRAAGENEQALSTSGISSTKIRYLTVTLHGVLCGLGGVYLSTGYLTQYVENMSAGRGFIAMAAIAFGAARPIRVFFAAFLFAFVESLSNRLQLVGLPPYFALMVPYIVTILVLAITSWREKRPKQIKDTVNS